MTTARRRVPLAIAALACALAPTLSCRPDLGERESLVTRTAVLAIRGEPPEAKPGEAVRYSLLVATPDGPLRAPSVRWAFCATPKRLTENGAASADCLGAGVVPIEGDAASVEAVTPLEACRLFGPEISSAELRPRDPDTTGGYYQPLRVTLDEARARDEGATVAIFLQRIACGLANASADATRDLAARYAPNENPELLPLEAWVDGRLAPLDAIPRGASVTLRASWPEGAAERYVAYDLARRAVVDRRESMRVSWFATAGAFESDRTGRAEEDLAAFADNVWTAPEAPGSAHLFVVLRDARGGVAFASYAVGVR